MILVWGTCYIATKWWIRKDSWKWSEVIFTDQTEQIIYSIKQSSKRHTMGENCECTRSVSTNNGYWYKDNKADERILSMSTLVNREGLTQRTVLLLLWGMERARCPLQQCLLNQGQQGWGPKWAYNCYTTLAPQQMSRCFRECRKSHDNYQYV